MTSVQYPKRDFFWSVASFSSDVSFSSRLFRTLRLIENWLPRCLLMLGNWYTERLRRERRRSLVPCRHDRERGKGQSGPVCWSFMHFRSAGYRVSSRFVALPSKETTLQRRSASSNDVVELLLDQSRIDVSLHFHCCRVSEHFDFSHFSHLASFHGTLLFCCSVCLFACCKGYSKDRKASMRKSNIYLCWPDGFMVIRFMGLSIDRSIVMIRLVVMYRHACVYVLCFLSAWSMSLQLT